MADPSGPIPEAPGETWLAWNRRCGQDFAGSRAVRHSRGLLVEHADVRNRHSPAPADNRSDPRPGRRPSRPDRAVARDPSGPSSGTGETWQSGPLALYPRPRGLPGGGRRWRGCSRGNGGAQREALPLFRVPDILPGPTRTTIAMARGPRADRCHPGGPGARLVSGSTTHLPGQSRICGETPRWPACRPTSRGAEHPCPSAITVEQILAWADAHFARRADGRTRSGAISEAPGETWQGSRTPSSSACGALPGGSSLPDSSPGIPREYHRGLCPGPGRADARRIRRRTRRRSGLRDWLPDGSP